MCIITCSHLLWFELPRTGSIFLDLIPPSESNHKPTRHILHRPKVECQQQNYRQEQFNEVTAHKTGDENIDDQSRRTEEDVEECSDGMPVMMDRHVFLNNAHHTLSSTASIVSTRKWACLLFTAYLILALASPSGLAKLCTTSSDIVKWTVKFSGEGQSQENISSAH